MFEVINRCACICYFLSTSNILIHILLTDRTNLDGTRLHTINMQLLREIRGEYTTFKGEYATFKGEYATFKGNTT